MMQTELRKICDYLEGYENMGFEVLSANRNENGCWVLEVKRIKNEEPGETKAPEEAENAD